MELFMEIDEVARDCKAILTVVGGNRASEASYRFTYSVVYAAKTMVKTFSEGYHACERLGFLCDVSLYRCETLFEF